MPKITIEVGNLSLEADLFATPTAESILDSLPLQGRVNVWGDEIYFEIPLELDLEAEAREDVAVGDLGYWPAGPAFCIFFGPTPVSTDAAPRAYSPVNVFGRLLEDSRVLRSVQDGSSIRIVEA